MKEAEKIVVSSNIEIKIHEKERYFLAELYFFNEFVTIGSGKTREEAIEEVKSSLDSLNTLVAKVEL